MFADDTSPFSVIHDVDASSAILNNNLVKIQERIFHWKISFNSDRNKQAQEVIISKKTRKVFHTKLCFNDQSIERTVVHKSDEKLWFTNCINDKINKALKCVGLLRKLSALLPRESLLTIYKSIIRPHFNYFDVFYDQPLNESLSNRIESVQCKTILPITKAIQGSSRGKLYQELGLEHLHQKRWMRRLCLFYKVF